MNSLSKIEHLPSEFTQDKVDLLKSTVCKGANNDEFQLFLHVCQRTGLDPFMKQIYSIPRGGQRTIQTSIDGLRLIAERTERYSPGKESIFVYDEKNCLISATSFVKKMTRDGTWHDVSETAMFSEYNPGNNTFWKKMPHVMLSKCAEAKALRRAFPQEMSGIYTNEEMAQAEKSEDNTIVIEENYSREQIESYLSLYGDSKEAMRQFMQEIMITRKWNERKTIETFEQHPDFTKKSFENWMSKRSNS